ncbi:hypothetical protein [Nocardia yamanashiensis]|nr:hypothetical protein [Nocardia yamanashiensis]
MPAPWAAGPVATGMRQCGAATGSDSIGTEGCPVAGVQAAGHAD